jgi:hypothetical protein
VVHGLLDQIRSQLMRQPARGQVVDRLMRIRRQRGIR